MANTVRQPNLFRIVPNAVTLKIYRTSDIPLQYNLTASTLEVNLYEDIDRAYISGQIHILDSSAIASLNFTGSESIVLRLWNNEDYQIEKEFVIWQVTDHTPINETTTSFVLHIMEPHAFLNNFRFVSRAYNNNHSKIIQNVLKDYLNVDADIEESFQSSKVVVPNLRPLQVCNWLTQDSTSQYGEPFFLYSSLKEGLKLRSLGSLYAEDALPIRFQKNPAAPAEFNGHAKHILAHASISNERMVDIQRKGLLRAERFVIDPFTNSIRSKTYDYKAYFDKKVAENRELYDGLPYDPSFPINGEERLGTSNPIYASSVNTSLSFGSTTTGIDEESTLNDHLLIRQAEGDRYMLDKNAANVTIPGWHMLAYEENTSIGRIIDINIPKPSPSTVRNNAEAILDQKYSGKFLITNVRHKFSFYEPAENYVAALTLKRTSNLDNSTVTGNLNEEPL
jgi:hypothetical protein